MFWESGEYFKNESSILRTVISPFLSYLRVWDRVASSRPDFIISNAKTPQARIKKYYGRDSEIIYPFVDIDRFRGEDTGEVNYFLTVSRLAPWKRIRIVVEACNYLRVPLKIIGAGPDYADLKKLAGPTVELLGSLTDEEVVSYYKHCRAFISPQEEDFGITPLEALAAGKPVIAYRAGGALETIVEGQVGEYFYPQTVSALSKVIKNFKSEKYKREICRKQALKFSKEQFESKLKAFVDRKYREHVQARKRL